MYPMYLEMLPIIQKRLYNKICDLNLAVIPPISVAAEYNGIGGGIYVESSTRFGLPFCIPTMQVW